MKFYLFLMIDESSPMELKTSLKINKKEKQHERDALRPRKGWA